MKKLASLFLILMLVACADSTTAPTLDNSLVTGDSLCDSTQARDRDRIREGFLNPRTRTNDTTYNYQYRYIYEHRNRERRNN